MAHNEWINELTDNASLREIARRTGISYSTINVQLGKKSLSAENVIRIAVAYGAHPVTALVDTGHLDEKWATTADPVAALREVSEEALADEVLRRMKIGVETESFTTPIGDMPLRAVADSSPDEDALRAAEEGGDDDGHIP